MRIFQSVFLNDTLDHDTRDTKADFVLVKSEKWRVKSGKKVGKDSWTAMKEYYLCNVDEDERRSAVGNGKYLSGLRKFPRCPARKNRELEIGKKQ